MFKKFSLILVLFLGLFLNITTAPGHDELCPWGSSCEEALWGSLVCCIGCCIFSAEFNKQPKNVYINNNNNAPCPNAPRPQQMIDDQRAAQKDKNL